MKNLISPLVLLITAFNSFAQISVSITPNPPAICYGSSTTLTANVSGGNRPYSYLWSNSSTDTMITVSPTITTTFSVTVTDNSHIADSAHVIITVNPLPNITIVQTGIICDTGDCVTLTASGASTYVWSNGDTTNSITVCPTVTTGYYVTGTNSYGCTNTDLLGVGVNPVNVSITVTYGSGYAELHASASGGTPTYSYYWSNGWNTSTIIVYSDTIYCVTITDHNGCTDSSCVNVVITSIAQLNIDNNNISIFPNPANDNLTIKIEDFRFENLELKICDIVGNTVLEKTLYNKVTNINITDISSGMYFLILRNDKEFIIHKILIQH